MASSPYASALGRLLPEFPAFLSRDIWPPLVAARDPAEVAKVLEETAYAPYLDAARATHQGLSLVEIAINRTFVRRNRKAYEAAPFAGRPVVALYLARYDVQNIELILSAKAQGRPVHDTEDSLISSREISAGLYAGVLTLDDYRNLLEQPTVEAVATQLVRYNAYGTTILPLLEAYARTRDIFPILHALEVEYYRGVLAGVKYFQGDEWIVRELLKSEIDGKNALLLLKAKAASLPLEEVTARWIDGGSLPASESADLYGARGVPELAERLAPHFPSITEGNGEFQSSGSLAGYESATERDRAVRELKRLRAYPLSLGVIFAYLLRAEVERDDVRRVTFGRLYGLAADRIEPLLVSPRL
ncbi:MAG: V-type ATPase subunit [Thermoplasmata archaeon]|jgi:V/A-type H+-transporting ATPase subunit C